MFDEMVAVDATTWQIAEPFDAVIFDCDGTLTSIEGIDRLAAYNHVSEEVEKLTVLAMEQGKMDQELYAKRLDLVKPSKAQIYQLAEDYYEYMTPNSQQSIDILRSFGKAVYVVSAGLTPCVEYLAVHYGLPKDHVYAVDLHFDEAGQYKSFDHHSPLITSGGKVEIVEQLRHKHERLVLIGDGMNDLSTLDHVDRFVGFGGSFVRQRVQEKSPFYITVNDFSALLPLVLTAQEEKELSDSSNEIYTAGLDHIVNHGVILRSTN